MPELTLDHIVVGIADLEAGIRQLERLTGVQPARGGEHPQRGTHNALLSLGPHTYLEIFAPVPGAPPTETNRGLAALHQLTPVGWALATRRPEAAVAMLQSAGLQAGPFQPGGRVRPDGKRLEWRTAEMLPAGDLNPFLIEWSATTTHPASDSPGGCTIESLLVLGPPAETAALARLVARMQEPVKVRRADVPGLRLTLHCPAGEVVLPAPATSSGS